MLSFNKKDFWYCVLAQVEALARAKVLQACRSIPNRTGTVTKGPFLPRPGDSGGCSVGVADPIVVSTVLTLPQIARRFHREFLRLREQFCAEEAEAVRRRVVSAEAAAAAEAETETKTMAAKASSINSSSTSSSCSGSIKSGGGGGSGSGGGGGKVGDRGGAHTTGPAWDLPSNPPSCDLPGERTELRGSTMKQASAVTPTWHRQSSATSTLKHAQRVCARILVAEESLWFGHPCSWYFDLCNALSSRASRNSCNTWAITVHPLSPPFCAALPHIK